MGINVVAAGAAFLYDFGTEISLISKRSAHLDSHTYKYSHTERRPIGVDVFYLFYLSE